MVCEDSDEGSFCDWLALQAFVKMSGEKILSDGMDFVTVVSVGSDAFTKINKQRDFTTNGMDQKPGYVTVLKIGDEDDAALDITEEVLVYRLPGERLGFGLKFEGGTKAAEFVSRLFIQSCAPDSPASMVQCSWGKLTEGDEVLKIDSQPVTSMTRIDCVRCLKDSNVVIKLLIKHYVNKKCDDTADGLKLSARVIEDLPHVIGAEKKRTPPPPPPVPPRKVPRKILKDPNLAPISNGNAEADNSTTPSNIEQLPSGFKFNTFQSPRNSGKFLRKSPESSRQIHKDRRFSDGTIGPPDAEVYLDLFSQEPCCNLSESDDTGSSISTIIDRLSSFPTTSNSSFAGSLPSTPTSIQKHLDVSVTFDNKDIDSVSKENYWYSRLALSQNFNENNNGLGRNNEYNIKSSDNSNDDAAHPPMSFQDAPLSYGNEDVGVSKNYLSVQKNLIQYSQAERMLEIEDENGNCIKDLNSGESVQDGVVCMRTLDNNVQNLLHPLNGLEYLDNDSRCLMGLDLPRLVYFMPKLASNATNKDTSSCEMACTTIESVKIFLENEIRSYALADDSLNNFLENKNSDMYNSELYNLSWSISPQLDTIGEDDEEGNQETTFLQSSTPIVRIEKVDADLNEEILQLTEVSEGETCPNDGDKHKSDLQIEIEPPPVLPAKSTICKTMDAPPNCSRQPPDGDEFPDYYETSTSNRTEKISANKITSISSTTLWSTSKYNIFRDQQSSCSVRDKIAIFSNTINTQSQLKKGNKSTDDIPFLIENDKELAKPKNGVNKVKRSLSTSSNFQYNFPQDTNRVVQTCERIDSRSLDLTTNPSHSRCVSIEKMDDVGSSLPKLHARSQSLMDISTNEKLIKKDRWSLLAENRQRSLSKLKGLVIPERVVEVEIPTVLDLPEIKINSIPATVKESCPTSLSFDLPPSSCQRNLNVPHLTSPPWSGKFSNDIPKYSPAFKRKSLQLHSEASPKSDTNIKKMSNATTESKLQKLEIKKPAIIKQTVHTDFFETNIKIIGTPINDAPKSLESITSPTRSDYSFEYISISPEVKLNKQYNFKHNPKSKSDVRKSDDDSDNDSAVSSSQSSYISRTTPPASPSHLYNNYSSNCGTNSITETDNIPNAKCENGDREFQLFSDVDDNQSHRLLKPQSVEAINRQNILASAKCRSGRDLKIGSPLIQRRFEEEQLNITLHNGVLATDTKPSLTTHNEIPNKNDVEIMKSESETNKFQKVMIKEQPHREHASKNPRLTKSKTVLKPPEVNSKGSQNCEDNKTQSKKSVNSLSVINLRKSFEKLMPTIPDVSNEINTSAIPRNKKTENGLTKLNVGKKQEFKKDSGVIPSTPSNLEDTIVLRPEFPGGSVGITLAGGADYETKEITVHKIRHDSPAYRDGRLRKGDIVLAINGKSVKGLTHKQLVALIKEAVPEVTLLVCKVKNCDIAPTAISPTTSRSNQPPNTEMIGNSDSVKQQTFLVSLVKDISGLGLSLEGGQDSLLGSKPLLIKKIFKGGAAEKSGKLQIGDEILLVNETDVSCMTRLEAWSILKKLPENVSMSLTVKRIEMP